MYHLKHILATLVLLFSTIVFSSLSQASLHDQMKSLYTDSQRVASWDDFPEEGYLDSRECRFVAFPDSHGLTNLWFYIADLGSNRPEFPNIQPNKRLIPWYNIEEIDCDLEPWRCTGRNDPVNHAIDYESLVNEVEFTSIHKDRERFYHFRINGEYIVFEVEFPSFGDGGTYQYGYCFYPGTELK